MGLFMKPGISVLANLKITMGSEVFQNPIWVASGTFGYGTEAPELVDVIV